MDIRFVNVYAKNIRGKLMQKNLNLSCILPQLNIVSLPLILSHNYWSILICISVKQIHPHFLCFSLISLISQSIQFILPLYNCFTYRRFRIGILLFQLLFFTKANCIVHCEFRFFIKLLLFPWTTISFVDNILKT